MPNRQLARETGRVSASHPGRPVEPPARGEETTLMEITQIPMDQAFAHVRNADAREACTTGAYHPLIMTHRGRLFLSNICFADFQRDIAIPPVGDRSACVIARGHALIDMDRFNHDPTKFLTALRAYWLA